MCTILVEARRDAAPGDALDRIAATCRHLGHDVVRWRGPLSGRVPYWRRLAHCDLAILWNGSHPRYAPAVQTLRHRGTKLLFVELGWHPQRGTIQIDTQGINARASWAQATLTTTLARSASEGIAHRTPLSIRSRGDLLVVLQLDRDTQITQLSPWFCNMRSFVEFVCQNSALPVRVRPHPRQQLDASFRQRVLQLGGTWDNSPSFALALSSAKAVACINSSCGVEALAGGLPVLCYGQAIYRHPAAVHCLRDDPQATRDATSALASGTCPLFREAIEEVVDRILSHQWPVDEIHLRLPDLLRCTLAATPQVTPAHPTWLTPLLRWTRDLPSRVLASTATARRTP
jgi:capsular polysaccharide biosynthesis protein